MAVKLQFSAMTDVNYLTVRLSGMRRHLLKSEDLNRLLRISNVDSLITSLRKTPYQSALENALLLYHPSTAVDIASNKVFSERVEKVLSISGGDLNACFKLLFFRWEVNNIRLAIRSVLAGQHTFPHHFIPLGQLKLRQLDELVACRDLKQALQFLETQFSPLAKVVRQFIEDEDFDPTNLTLIDAIFRQHYYDEALEFRGFNHFTSRNAVAEMRMLFQAEAEKHNVQSLLTIASLLHRQTIPRNLTKDLNIVILPGKTRIRVKSLQKAIEEANFEFLIDELKRTVYHDIFQGVINKQDLIPHLRFLSEKVERLFHERQIKLRTNTFIALALMYYWKSYQEARNIQIINHGLDGGFTAEEIKEMLVLA